MINTLAIIGAGGWGTALSIALARNAETIRLWVYEADLCESLRQTRTNGLYLPGFLIPPNVTPTGEMQAALDGAAVVILAVPSRHMRAVCREMTSCARPGQVFLSAAKGLERGTLLRMSEVIRESLGNVAQQLGVLSGPTFAREVAHGLPAALVVASEDESLAVAMQQQLSTPSFRLYTNNDVIGVELAGAVKNVIAIAAGVCEGTGLGTNAIAAVVTRGLAEMTRLACACGARRETLTGLAGLGDLVLTCTGPLSRNRSTGVELGRGRSLQDIVSSTHMAIEGIPTASATLELARRHGLAMPITEQVHAMLHGNVTPQQALRELMDRSLKPE